MISVEDRPSNRVVVYLLFLEGTSEEGKTPVRDSDYV